MKCDADAVNVSARIHITLGNAYYIIISENNEINTLILKTYSLSYRYGNCVIVSLSLFLMFKQLLMIIDIILVIY